MLGTLLPAVLYGIPALEAVLALAHASTEPKEGEERTGFFSKLVAVVKSKWDNEAMNAAKLTLFITALVFSTAQVALQAAFTNLGIMGVSFFALREVAKALMSQAQTTFGLTDNRTETLKQIFSAILGLTVMATSTVFMANSSILLTFGIGLAIPMIMPNLFFDEEALKAIDNAFSGLFKAKNLNPITAIQSSWELMKALFNGLGTEGSILALGGVAIWTLTLKAFIIALFTTPPLYVALGSVTLLSFCTSYCIHRDEGVLKGMFKDPFVLVRTIFEAIRTIATGGIWVVNSMKKGVKDAHSQLSTTKDTPVTPPDIVDKIAGDFDNGAARVLYAAAEAANTTTAANDTANNELSRRNPKQKSS